MVKLFFERMKEKRGEVPSTFSYDALPGTVRTQIVLIARVASFKDHQYKKMCELLREAIGQFSLADGQEDFGYSGSSYSFKKELFDYFITTRDVEKALSVIELLGTFLVGKYRLESASKDRINSRLLQAGIGWKIGEDGLLFNLEDETFFEEVTAPCLSILGKGGFSQAHKHFLDAYQELKQKKFDDALTDCGQSIESVIKTRLCQVGVDDVTHLNWNKLRPLLLKHIIIPSYLQNYQNNLFEVMGGLLTARNKDGAHGSEEGAASQLDECFVRFAINQTAANILFIAEAEFQ